jgi:Flp pilus assembly protein TadD
MRLNTHTRPSKPGPALWAIHGGRISVLAMMAVALGACSGFRFADDTPREPSMRVADAAMASGAPDLALRVADLTLARHPRNARALVARGDALYSMGQSDQARAAYRAAAAVDPNSAGAQIGLGRTLARSDPRGAETAFLAALRVEPDNGLALNNLGVTRDIQGRHAEAQDAYRQALQVAPDSADVRINLGMSMALSGRGSEAVPMLRDVARDPGAAQALRKELTAALTMAGDASWARQALKSDPGQAPRGLPAESVLASLPPEPVVREPVPAARPPEPAVRAPVLAAQPPEPVIMAPIVVTRPPDTVIKAPVLAALPPQPAVRAPAQVSQVPEPVARAQVVASQPVRPAPDPVLSVRPKPEVAEVNVKPIVAPQVPEALTASAPVNLKIAAPSRPPAADANPSPLLPMLASAAPVPPKTVAPKPVVAAEPAALAKPIAVPQAQYAAARPAPSVIPPEVPQTLARAPFVQLGSLLSEPDARFEWSRLSRRLADALDGREPAITPAEVHGRTYWRLRAFGFADLQDAKDMCADLRDAGWDCWSGLGL